MISFNFLKKQKPVKPKISFDSNYYLRNSSNNASFSIEAYSQNVIVYRSINMIATSIAYIPIISYVKDSVGNKTRDVNNKFLDVIENPNLYTTKAEFFEQIVVNLMIYGDAFIMKNDTNPPTELFVLKNEVVNIEYDYHKVVYGYTVQSEGEESFFPVNTLYPDILHMKVFNPKHHVNGFSPMKCAKSSIEQYNQSIEWNKMILMNGARPSGAMIVKQDQYGNSNLSEEQFCRLKNEIDELFSSNNVGRPILLEGGVEWKEMSLSPKDMDFMNCKNSAARDIALAFGVPPQLLCIPGDNTYSNLSEARIGLWEQTILPLAEKLKDKLNSWLSGYFGEVELSLDRDGIESLILKREQIWKSIEGASFMTINEKRKMFGLDDIDGYDKIFNKND